jgi:hypothetical protein
LKVENENSRTLIFMIIKILIISRKILKIMTTMKICSLHFQLSIFNYFLNANPFSASAVRNFGNEPGPVPWKERISLSVCLESFCNVAMPLFCNARLAGAESVERKFSEDDFEAVADLVAVVVFCGFGKHCLYFFGGSLFICFRNAELDNPGNQVDR